MRFFGAFSAPARKFDHLAQEEKDLTILVDGQTLIEGFISPP